jgi:nucleotide-binding universal stress UspA family protein
MKRILLAYNGDDSSRRALDRAAELAHALGAPITVVSVVPVRYGHAAAVDPWDDEAVHDAELREARELLAERGLDAELVRLSGLVPQAIEALAARNDFDLVVVGSRHLGTVWRVLLQSVSEHVASHTNASVVIAA